MMVEVLQSLADWLDDDTQGVNACAATLPRRVTDGPLPTVRVTDETRSGWVTRGEMPREQLDAGPWVAVYQAGDAVMPGEKVATYREITVDVGVRLIAGDTASAHGTRDLHDLLRAIHRSVRGWLADAESESARIRNAVYVEISEQWRQTPVLAVEEDAVVTASLLLTLTVRDQAPEA